MEYRVRETRKYCHYVGKKNRVAFVLKRKSDKEATKMKRCVVLLKRLSLHDAKKNNSGNSKQSEENVAQDTNDAHDIQGMDELVVTKSVDSITSTENVIPSIDSCNNGRPEKSQLGGDEIGIINLLEAKDVAVIDLCDDENGIDDDTDSVFEFYDLTTPEKMKMKPENFKKKLLKKFIHDNLAPIQPTNNDEDAEIGANGYSETQHDFFDDNDLNISLGDIVDELNVLEFENPGLFRDLDTVLDQLTQ